MRKGRKSKKCRRIANSRLRLCNKRSGNLNAGRDGEQRIVVVIGENNHEDPTKWEPSVRGGSLVSGRARRDGSATEAWIVGGFQHGRCLLRKGSGGRCRYAWTRSSPSPPPSSSPSPSPSWDRRRVYRRRRRRGCHGCCDGPNRTANRPTGSIDRHCRHHHRRCCCCCCR